MAALAGHPEAVDPGLESVLTLFDSLRPEAMLELAQQQLGEMVQFGTVVALGCSGRYHGLKHTLWPVGCAAIPGLPTSFAVVFYFLLETRQDGHGGTLLPVLSTVGGAVAGLAATAAAAAAPAPPGSKRT